MPAQWFCAPLIAIFFAMLTPLAAIAHTGLSGSVPAAGATLSESPCRLELSFDSDVRLIDVGVTDSNGNKVELETTRQLTPAKSFDIPLPSLAPGEYQVRWVVMGGDSHKMSGKFDFTLATAEAANGEDSP